jgi:lipopolysaccharide transport system permease protein
MSDRAPSHESPVVRIEATSGWVPISLAELWAYREVIYYLAWRDVKARYKQTVFGASWAVFQPLVSMVIFSVIFGGLAKLPSDGIPYPIFSFAALVPWTFFANTVTKASNSLVGGGGLVNRIYFPRLAMPLSSVLGNLLDFAIAFAVLLVLMWYYGIVPTANVLWLPALLVLAVATSLGVSLVLTSLNVQFRDVHHAVPFLVQAWMYATPVVYPASLIQDPVMQTLYALNPMVGVVEGFRWALLGADTAPGPSILTSAAVAATLLVAGAYYFKRMERTFADLL